MLLYHHLGVWKHGNAIVVRFGDHQILDELTVKKITEELYAYRPSGRLPPSGPGFFQRGWPFQPDARQVADASQDNRLQEGTACFVRRWSRSPRCFGRHKAGHDPRNHGERG